MATQFTGRDSIAAILSEMTLEEKATLLTGGSTFATAALEKYGIPAALFVDAGGGVNLRQYLSNLLNVGRIKTKDSPDGGMGTLSQLVYIMDNLDHPENLNASERELLDVFREYLKGLVPCGDLPSCFPVNSLLASSWDPKVVRACGEAVGREASAFGVDMLLGTPCINIQRDPRGGRGFEGYSEDPYLISRLAPEYPKGVQEQGVIADLKHFAVNNQETNRQTIKVHISERALREIYLPGFEACVRNGGVRNVMTSYNWINGVAAAHNKWLIEDVLRGEWGFDGFVVSDWGGVYDQAAAIQAGNDICMPGPRSIAPIIEAVQSGKLSEEKLDICVERFLNVLADMPVMRGRRYEDIDSEASREVAYQAALAGMVLLKNEDGCLPLSDDVHVCFYGKESRHFVESGVGSGRVHTNKTSDMVGCVAARLGEGNVSFENPEAKADAVVVTLFAAGQEGADRDDMCFTEEMWARYMRARTHARSCGSRLIVVLNIAGPVDLETISREADAILLVYFPGQEGGHAAADLLTGHACPSGKLAQTFPRRLADVPAYMNFPGEYDDVNYGEGIFVGYRWYDARGIAPLYPFGFGLSYTSFEISDVQAKETFNYDEDAEYSISLKLTNQGKCDGAEVVQIYLSDDKASLPRPVQELKAFEKVFLRAGESKRVDLKLNRRDLMFYDARLGRWVCEPGGFEIRIGTSSRDIVAVHRFRAKGKNPYAFGAQTQFRKLISNARARQVWLDAIPSEIMSEEELKRKTAYIAFHFTVEMAFDSYIRPKMNAAQADHLFEQICSRLGEIDESTLTQKYEEKEIF